MINLLYLLYYLIMYDNYIPRLMPWQHSRFGPSDHGDFFWLTKIKFYFNIINIYIYITARVVQLYNASETQAIGNGVSPGPLK